MDLKSHLIEEGHRYEMNQRAMVRLLKEHGADNVAKTLNDMKPAELTAMVNNYDRKALHRVSGSGSNFNFPTPYKMVHKRINRETIKQYHARFPGTVADGLK